jgi:DNA polymerase-1
MGADALQGVMSTTGITDMRGRFFPITEIDGHVLPQPVTVYCMSSPSTVFRRWEDYPIILEDFRKLGRMIREGWSEEKLGDYRVITNLADLRSMVDYLLTQPRVGFDLETTSYNFWDFNLVPDWNILCASFSAYPGTGFVVPFLGHKARRIWTEEEFVQVKAILQEFWNSVTPKWAQNGIFDINFIRSNGWEFNLDSFTFDTMLCHHTLQENTPHGLDFLLGVYTNMPLYSHALKEWKANNKLTTYADFPEEMLWTYSGADADALIRVGDALSAQLDYEYTDHFHEGVWEPIPLRQFFEQIVMPLNRALVDMEYRGIVLDATLLEELQATERVREATHTQEVWRLVGREINLQSPAQLVQAFFNPPTPPSTPGWDGKGIDGKAYVPGLGLPVNKRTASGAPSTDVEVLAALWKATSHPVVGAMMEIRKSQKKISTYLAGKDGEGGMIKFWVERTGRVYPSYKQHTVVTGRLSTSEPAIHNIPDPDKDPEYAQLRLLFTVPEGWWLLQADYSQLELRVVASVCQEEVMLEAFRTGRDIHRLVAGEAFGVGYDEVSDQQRRAAKAINFGIVYGISAYGLAEEIQVSQAQAQEFINKYFARFKGLKRYFDAKHGDLREKGEVSNNFGRKRRLYGYQFFDPSRMKRYSGGNDSFVWQCKFQREEMERQAVNFGVQSSGSDLLSAATAEVHQRYKSQKMLSGLVITHHDALYVETPATEVLEAAWIMHSCMERAYPQLGNVSFPVDLKVGKRWEEVDKTMTATVYEYIAKKKAER